jgi:hypothetical protein
MFRLLPLLTLMVCAFVFGEEAAAPVALPPAEPIPEDAALEEGFERIFNGKDLTGWEGEKGLWLVEKGMLVGHSDGLKKNQFLGTEAMYGDFVLKFKFQLVGVPGKGMINSGCQFRSLRVPNSTEACGYQADIGDGWWGALYDESRRNKVLVKPGPEVEKDVVKKNGWNDYVVTAKGDTITLELNGTKTIEWTETEPVDKVARDGHIFFQMHAGAPMEIRIKDVRIKKL